MWINQATWTTTLNSFTGQSYNFGTIFTPLIKAHFHDLISFVGPRY
jgi:hypothetical protein